MAAPNAMAPSTLEPRDVPMAASRVHAVDAQTMLDIDHIATEQIGLGLLQMLENAGRELAQLTRRALGGSAAGRSVVVLAGTGNNAGGGLAGARHLAGWGAKVLVAFARPVRRLRPGPCAQLEPAIAAGVQTAVSGHDLSHRDLADAVSHAYAVIDALVGYSLRGAPDDAYRSLIEITIHAKGPVISLDVPSGIDASTGARPGVAVAADMTLALGLPKRGSTVGEGLRHSGSLYLADIGIPRSVYERLAIDDLPNFTNGPLLRLE